MVRGKKSILVVDDEPKMLQYIRTVLEQNSYQVETVTSGEEAVRRVRADSGYCPDILLLDITMPGMDGLKTLENLRSAGLVCPVAMISCTTEIHSLVRSMQLGARDYLLKPFTESDLLSVIDRLQGELFLIPPIPAAKPVLVRSNPKPVTLPAAGKQNEGIVELPNGVFMVCCSPAMQKVTWQASTVAEADIPVLLLGETGTGKDVLAAFIHNRSSRAHKPLLKVNCAAVPGDLLESELFGYEAGAFTGAVKSKPGKFEQCNGGTIFLDEIGEMPSALQAKLLQVLQDREYSRLGGRSVTKVDVRVISATNINVQEAIASKKLRSDLYYRLNGLSLRLPPLRERREEIPILLREFVRRHTNGDADGAPPITPRLMEACLSYAWPGNARELLHFVNRYLVLADEESAIAEISGSESHTEISKGLKSISRAVKYDAEMVAIAEALRQTKGKRKAAANLLQISYKALLYKMRQFDVPLPRASVR
jgi:DNA-binding NtrC family response regulator